MPKRPKVITEEQLIAAAEHLAKSRDEFVEHLRMTMEAFISVNERFRTYGEFLDKRDELLASRMTLHGNVLDALMSLQKVLTENTVALNENTERVDKFLTKFETYFGTDRGLELDN
jgi:hypothetical protein